MRRWAELGLTRPALQVEACRKAQRNLEQAQKKVQQAESKQEHDKLQKAKKQLESIRQGHLEVRHGMEVKLLEVQQDKHDVLRAGYMNLYKAQSKRGWRLGEALFRSRVTMAVQCIARWSWSGLSLGCGQSSTTSPGSSCATRMGALSTRRIRSRPRKSLSGARAWR